MPERVRRTWRLFAGPSRVGLLLGLAFFALSLTPSLLPRPVAIQGVLSGVVFAVGYAVGYLIHRVWRFMDLKDAGGGLARALTWAFAVLLVLGAAWTSSRMATWQNSVRLRMDMEPIDSGYPLLVLGIAFVTALLLVFVTRLLLWGATRLIDLLERVLPRRVAIVLGGTLFAFLVVSIVNGVILSAALRGMDASFAALDQLIDDGIAAPTDELATGGPGSLIDWDDIGRNGKRFLLQGPTKDEIQALTGREAMPPIRVYAGYHTGDDLEARARVAVEELERLGGFERSTLVVATATGTGWLDPSAVDPVEFLHGGDIATVSLQYSYLPSWLTLMVEPTAALEAGSALFRAVYDRWTGMPRESRPALHLFGLSLGSLGSEHSADMLTMVADPIHGALWAGPPFPSPNWNHVTRHRNPGSPAWRPVFRDSRAIRFATQDGFPELSGAPWGPVRLVYLQYPSDPMTFFSPSLAFRRPDWLGPDRGRDVSPYLRWIPLVTFCQVAFDIPLSTSVPLGYGHSFAPEDYIDAWLEVTQPEPWTEADTQKLKAHFADFDPSPL